MSKYRVTTDQGVYEVTTEDLKQSFGKKAMGFARIPSEMLGATLDVAKGQIPTRFGKGAMNVLSKTMPPTFTPLGLGSMVGAEAMGPLMKAASPAVRGFGEQLESLVGSPKGTLARGFQSAKNIFGPGKQAAKPFYGRAMEAMPKGTSVFEGMYKPEQIVDKAREILSGGGKLEPSEGLTYRKAVDALARSGRYVKDEIFKMRDEADAIAKGSRLIRKGDQIYQAGIRNQALRRPFPLTSTGKTATVKTGMMFVPGIGQALAPLFSPAIQGAAATGLGAGTRLASNPGLVALLNSLISQGLQRRSQLPENPQ
jgi:hypothetical protein